MADKFTLEVIDCGDGLRPSSNKEKKNIVFLNKFHTRKKKTNKKENIRKRESKNCL